MAGPIRNNSAKFSRDWAAGPARRWTLVGLSFAGCAVSCYLALFQYGFVASAWEPFFGSGSSKVLTAGILSWLNPLVGFPVHDAALGAIAYFVEAWLAIVCLRHRVSPRPWLVAGYCGFAVSMGLTSLVLVALQAKVIRAWCTLCLVSAATSEVIVLLSLPEMISSARFLAHWWSSDQKHRSGHSIL